jgi:hypothetical protein
MAMITHRCRIENRMIRSKAEVGSVVMAGARLFDVGFDQEAVPDDVFLSDLETA